MNEPKRPCEFPACPGLVDEPKRWCPAHERARGPKQEQRPSAAARGYDAAWRRFRLWFLGEHPLCTRCLVEGVSEPARDVHHIKALADYPELQFEPTNLEALCQRCHSRETASGVNV